VTKHHIIRFFLAAATTALALGDRLASPSQHRAKPPHSVRLYVFDCGTLTSLNGAFSLTKEEVVTPTVRAMLSDRHIPREP